MKQWITTLKVMLLILAITLATSCGNGTGLPEINGVKGPIFSVMNGQIIMTVKFLNMQADAGIKVPVPKTENSALELAPNAEDGGMMLQLYLDFMDLANIGNIDAEESCALPDERPLPGIPGGTLENCLRVDTDWKDISFFYHKKLFGLWMPFGFETAGISGYWNMWFNSKNVGFLGIVGNDEEHHLKAGGVVLLRLENLKNRQLQRLIELSQRNPHLVY